MAPIFIIFVSKLTAAYYSTSVGAKRIFTPKFKFGAKRDSFVNFIGPWLPFWTSFSPQTAIISILTFQFWVRIRGLYSNFLTKKFWVRIENCNSNSRKEHILVKKLELFFFFSILTHRKEQPKVTVTLTWNFYSHIIRIIRIIEIF